MICRLCLSEAFCVPIFKIPYECTDKGVAYLILKHLSLELSPEDNISTSICLDCHDHLEDFHEFWLQIERKQKTLEDQFPLEFFEVKCIEANNQLGKNNEDVDITAVKEELLEFEIDPVCNDSNSIEEQKDESSDIWQPLLTRKKHKVKTTEIRKSKHRNQKSQDVLDKTPSMETAVTNEHYELSCEICKERIGNLQELYRHFENNHKELEAFVKCCGKKFTQPDSIVNHFRRHRSTRKFYCPICNKALCSEINLNIHMNSKHNEEKKESYKCHVCQKEFRSQKYCEKHILRHGNEKKSQINCDKCKRSFSSNMRLKRHCQIMHEAVYPYKCQACEENFLSKKEVETHQTFCKNRSVLEDNNADLNISTDLICKVCCKIFANLNRLRKHIAFVHENVHPYVCEQCGKKFKFKPTFETHLLQHAGVVEPPAQCNVCGKWLKHKNSLRLHLYSHDNSVNKCELCDHVAPTRTALRHHVKKVHRLEREYQCKYCEKSFKDTKSQEEHIATHTGAQLYSCPHCSKETRSSSNMYAHIKRMHPEDWLKAKLARSHDPNAKINLEVLAS